MIFNEHSALRGKHAFLSPSAYHWSNYDEVKLRARYFSSVAAARGVDLHAFAHKAIELGIRLPEGEDALAAYVNDGIDYGLRVEQPLYYSDNCFGHADTLGFRSSMLRIHDLKTGIIPCKMRQLEIYAAIFCLEYGYSPYDIEIELRIYQRQEVMVDEPSPDLIMDLMDRIVYFDQLINDIKAERG